jgi:NADH-quinone oxidoreductase subunit G
MPKLTINGVPVEVPQGFTVLQACQQLGLEVPVFCYHARLSIAGNCRTCLVEMKRSAKPIASCAMPASDGMVIHADSPVARKAQRGGIGLLLINHPLDCPICDQGGECDLQDEAMAYGFDRSRSREPKRAVRAKDFGPLIATYMTRCIHCTRCIRFLTQVAGVPELGAMYRGEDMEIDTYIHKALTSELSGNIIDLCPVGALTSRPYAFLARPWELTKTDSIDVFDAVGSNIRVDARGPQVLRVLPRTNDEINEEWLSDKARFATDGLIRRRLDRPFIGRGSQLHEANWSDAFIVAAGKIAATPPERIATIAGDLADAESMLALKDLTAELGSPNLDCRQDGAALDPRCRAGYLFNTTIAGIEKADACLLLGTDPRHEAPLINARLRKRWLHSELQVGAIGPVTDLTYPVAWLGNTPAVFAALVSGQHWWNEILDNASAPMLILGQGALRRPDGAAILHNARMLAERCRLVREGWNGFNVLHMAAARVGGLDLGFVPGPGGRDIGAILDGANSGQIEVVYLLGADEIDRNRLGKAFVIYQGHHGDRGASRANVIFPGAAYTEKDATYVNTEGREQRGRRAVFPPGDAREDWRILRAFSEALGHPLPYNTLAELRKRLSAVNPVFAAVDQIVPAAWGDFGIEGPMASTPFVYPIADFYRTDPIGRASPTMAECARVAAGKWSAPPRPIF